MATCNPCQNEDYTPDAACCPDTQERVNAIDGRDRNCQIRRIIPSKGFLASIGSKAGFLDGSSSQPIEANFETTQSTNGYVIVQTASGRILALNPNQESVTETLQLVYDGGALKFVPISGTSSFADAEIVSSTSGILASFACSSDGRIQLSKFIPGCEGSRHLVIDTEGNVTCDTVAVGECRDVTAVDELDSLWGCKDGVYSPILPVLGKTLVGSGDPVKWTLGEATSGINLIDPFVSLASGGYSGVNNGIMYTGNISWASQPGYLASYRYVIVRAIGQLGSRGMDTTGTLRLDGKNMITMKVREHPTLTCDHDSDTNQQILPIPGSKVSLLEFVLTDLGNSQANALNEASFNFYLEGWVS